MNKKLLLLFAFILTSITTKAQDSQCQNLVITKSEINCAFPITTLDATFLNFGYKTTDTYAINGEVACLPDVTNGTGTGIVGDDDWSDVFPIGFNFCYFGNTYDQIIISDNGKISFDLENAGTNDSNWRLDIGDQLPNINFQSNCIFAPFFDTDTRKGRYDSQVSPTTIAYKLDNQFQIGERVLRITYNMYSYGSNCDTPLVSVVSLYETSNVIDIEIRIKDVCTDWNNGRALVGIQNKSATIGISPGQYTDPRSIIIDNTEWDPRRTGYPNNLTIDKPDGELWRFIPDGNDLGYEFKWYADYGQGNGFEELFPNQQIDPPSVEVNPTTQTEYKAILTYQNECSFDQISLEETLIVEAPIHDNVQEPIDLTLCEETFGTGTADFSIDQFDTLLTEYINSTTETWDMTNFTVSYYSTETDRDDDTNAIDPSVLYTAANDTTIYVRIIFNDGSIDCFDVYHDFKLNVVALADTSFSYPQSIYCTVDDNPFPLATTIGGEYTIDNGGVIDALSGEVDIAASGGGIDETGIFNITYTITTETFDQDNNLIVSCPNSTSVTISIEVTNSADFTYPATACIADTTNPAPIQYNSGGTFSINNGGNINTTTGEIDLTNIIPGTYEVTYTFNANGNCPSSDMHSIEILTQDDASFTYPNAIYCNDDANPSPTSVTNGGTYTINNGGVLVDANTGEINLSDSGSGTDDSGNFEITYTTNGNCANSSTFQLTIVIREDAGFDFPTDVCSYDENPRAFDIITSGGIFNVNNGASIDNNGVLDLTTTIPGTTYEITYGFLTGNCPSSTTKMITVHESPIANMPSTIPTECNNGDGTANFDISGLDSEILGNQTGVSLTYHATYQDADDNVNVLNTTPFARVNGNIFARVENTNGCVTIIEIYLTVEDCYTVIPQGFSPNSDIIENQTFNVKNLRTKFPKFKLHIYNRFGNLVYEGDANSENWNGKLNNDGELLPAGTYFYGISLNDEQELKYRGWVYLQQ